MLAIGLRTHGDPSVLLPMDLPTPIAGPGQVLVRVQACALNRLDLFVRSGLPNLHVTYPHILGSDIAGTVAALGPGVTELQVGDEVVVAPGVSCGRCEACLSGWDNLCPDYAILGENAPGGYAEAVVVPASNVFRKPTGLSMVEAAAVPLTFLTAWQMLVVRGEVGPGTSVLIHAAGSGVGVAAVQIAKLFGARVIALASTETKLARARELGAEHTILSADPSWPKAVRALPGIGKRGVDVVFEHVGKATWSDSIRLCKNGGKVVTCGASSGYDAMTDLRHVFFRQVQILGSTMGSKSLFHTILAHVEAGRLRPVVDRTFPLEAAREAHVYLDRREQFGKVVLEVGPA